MWAALWIAVASAEDVDETVIVEGSTIQEAREAVEAALAEEGYHRARHRKDRTVFVPDDGWKSRVVLYDEGYIEFRNQPVRLHAPGQNFAGEGNPALWALCVVQPQACIDMGTRVTRLTDARVVELQRGKVAEGMDDELRVLQERIVADRMKRRLEVEIPEQCAEIWARDLPAAERRRLLFDLWDSRTETTEGEAAREVVRAFLAGVVQTSADPFTTEEIAAFNARRKPAREFAP